MSEPNLSSEKGGLVSPNGNIIPEGESQTMSTATPGDACAPGSSHTKKRKRFDKLSLHESDSGDELSDDDLDLDTGNSSLISVSESESGSEGRSQVGKTPSSGTKRLKGPKRTRFDPCGSSDTAKQSLPADMVDYVDKNFRKFIDNKIINEKILELHPIPVNALSLSVPEVDDYVHEIFEARSTSINRISDQSFRKIQGKLLKVMGPVSRLWTMFDAVNSSPDPEMDFEEVSTLMEQTVTLIGQVNVALSYERRLSIMAKMTGEAEKSKKILKKNQEIFMRAKKSLFGKKFYKTLTKLARVKKASHDISSQLSKKKKVKNVSSGSKYSSRQKEQPSSSTMANPQPFHKGPHFRGRGRGAQSAQAFSRGKSKVSPVLQQGTPKQSATSRSTTGKRLVKLRLSKHDPTSKSGVNSSYGCMSKSLVSAPKQKPALRRKTKLFHRKFAKLTKDPSVLEIVSGIKIPFISCPIQDQIPVCSFSKNQTAVIDLEIAELLQKKAIVRVSPCPDQFLSSIFLVPKKDGGNRPVINLKHLNQFVEYQHFKMEGLDVVKNLLKKGDFMIKIDMKDAYFSVGVNNQFKRFLCFNYKKMVYMFQCMAFGLGPAPRLWTKLLKPVVAFLRRIGMRIVIYLDDMLIMNQSSTHLLRDRDTVLWVLQQLGFLINWKKSILIPFQVGEFLGFILDSVQMTIHLPQTKINQIISHCRQLLLQDSISVRDLSRIIGRMTASMQAIFPAPLHYRILQMTRTRYLIQGQSYETMLILPQSAREELIWWINNISLCNGKTLVTPAPDLVISTDASKMGWGAVCGLQSTQGQWTKQEASLHINVLEMKAADFGIRAFTKNQNNIHVHLKSDNRTTVAYVMKMGGTVSLDLVQLTKDLWEYCLKNQIYLTAEHVKGILNVDADQKSRVLLDSSDWKLNPSIFLALMKVWGPFQMDLFASRHNAQVQRFVSWKPDPFAVATDAFLLQWGKENQYAFPPFSLIARCLAKVVKDRGQMPLVIITPTWQTQPWYAILLEMSVEEPILIPPALDLLKSPKGENHPLMETQSLCLAAWKVSGDVSKQREFRMKQSNFSQSISDDQVLTQLTTAPGISGLAGFFNEVMIPFKPLWPL